MANRNLKESLNSLAQEAPDISALRTSLVPRIRRRRRGRQSLAAAAVVVAAGALSTGVIIGTSSIGPDNSGPAPSSGSGVTIGACGSPVTGQVRTDLPLQLTAPVWENPLSAGEPYAKVDIQVTNRSSAAVNILTAAEGADVTIVKDGIVVRPSGFKHDQGRRFTLKAGETRTFTSNVNMLRCDPVDGASPAVPLDSGTYQLYATQHFRIVGEPGQVREDFDLQGGPWDIQIAP